MMPLAPTPVISVPTKPKIGFSIDSIVGHHRNNETGKDNRDNSSPSSPQGSHLHKKTVLHVRSESPSDSDGNISLISEKPSPSVSPAAMGLPQSQRSQSESPPSHHQNPPTLVRPSPFGLEALMHHSQQQHHKSLYHPSMHHDGNTAIAMQHAMAGLPSFAAAAAGLAGLQPQQLHGGHGSFPAMFLPGAGGAMGHLPHHVHRDTYPLYPWLLSRHGRIFPHRFPPGPELPGFLLQPFRKPKRIRTAFSPSQLLKLEHAFEKNHYVVGAERKQLAQVLALTETQVKVWFQNRRTKHKRMQQEEEAKTTSPSPSSASKSTNSNNNGTNLSNPSINNSSLNKWKTEHHNELLMRDGNDLIHDGGDLSDIDERDNDMDSISSCTDT